jgi:hypothetical protein
MKRTSSVKTYFIIVFSLVTLLSFTQITQADYDLLDPCDKISEHWRRVGSSAGENAYISDSWSQYGNVPEGQYHFYVEPGGAAGSIRKEFVFSDESWVLELSAKIVSLLETPPPYRWWGSGFAIDIYTGTKRHRILLTKGRIDTAVSLEGGISIDPELMEGDTDFHKWKFIYSAEDMTLEIYKDGLNIASFSQVQGNNDTLSPRIQIVPSAGSYTPDSEPIDIYIDEIAFGWGEYSTFFSFDNVLVYPSVFSDGDQVRIAYSTKEECDVQLSLYDEKGANVWSLKYEGASKGYNEVLWDGKDMAGNLLPSGIYLAVVSSLKDGEVDILSKGTLVKVM